MYSLVLMTALTAGGNAPEGCFFSCDPFPSCASWCYTCGPYWGGGCGPCWGYPWYNCYVSYYCPCWNPYGNGAVVIQGEGIQGEKIEGIIEKKKEEKKQEKKKEDSEDKEAKLVVELPADARLFIDGSEMKSGATQRGVVTPPLDPQQTYYYEVKVELTRHGHTLRETQRIRLIPGALVTANFTNLENRAAAIVQAGKR
jgi:uncharacterized protein (TIGR03000 family)